MTAAFYFEFQICWV